MSPLGRAPPPLWAAPPLPEAELAVELLGVERENVLGGLQDGLRDEEGAVGAGFDAAAEEVIEGFGVGTLPAHFVFETA